MRIHAACQPHDNVQKIIGLNLLKMQKNEQSKCIKKDLQYYSDEEVFPNIECGNTCINHSKMAGS